MTGPATSACTGTARAARNVLRTVPSDSRNESGLIGDRCSSSIRAGSMLDCTRQTVRYLVESERIRPKRFVPSSVNGRHRGSTE